MTSNHVKCRVKCACIVFLAYWGQPNMVHWIENASQVLGWPLEENTVLEAKKTSVWACTNFIDFWNFYDGLVGIFNFIWQNLTLATIDNCKIFEVIPTTKGTDSKQNLFRLIPYRLFHGELVIQDKAQHSSVDFNLLN